ncbi:unnamed protein product [Linum tenue]|uniref:Pectinesterase n=1 Tax=Linum tenue TaxID=586396 RepID=A0AAV0KAG1_9ROSI|nr:unnamed protein product [Linum tenue]
MSHQHKPLRSGLSISTVFLILFLIGTVAAAGVDNAAPSPSPNPEYNQYHLPSSQQPQTNPGHNSNHHAVLRSACSNTRFPDLCFSAVAAVPGAAESLTTQKDVIEASINITCRAVQRNFFTVEKLIRSAAGRLSRREKTALHDCLETIDETLDELRAAYRDLNQYPYKKSLNRHAADLKTLLSAAMTNQETCLDGFSHDGADRRVREALLKGQVHVERMCSNVLAMIKNMTDADIDSLKAAGLLSDFNIPIHRRRRLMTAEAESDSGFPRWVSDGDRRMLQQVGGAGGLRPNVTVAQDGSGNFTTIAKAVELIPKKSLWKYIIYIKQGTYKENVILDKHRWNVLVYGDGKDKTIVSGSLNFVDGTPTFDTATFAVQGKNFMARDMKFINTAGPEKHQAVAFRSGADMSVYYRCSFDAYQDTLYPHSNRQFYRDCDITGTIDFIFGNAAVVFQGCKIQPRQPMSNQFNTITAQGKKDPNQNTGISIQKCDFTPLSANLTARTYLGRPWKDFSTTVIMQSSIGGFLNQLGWLPWVSGVEPPNTIFYAEYQNTGPGSSVAGRVKWAGYKPALTKDEAARFTVGSFIQGGAWLPATSVAFDSAL